MADDSLHEIQLSGKQIVFVFMAVTVVSVVIFLCGVLVGRGVRAAQEETAAIVGGMAAGGSDASGGGAAANGTGAEASRTAATDELSYPRRLEGAEPPPEVLKGAPEPPPAPAEPALVATGDPALSLLPPPAGEGFAVQVAALRERGEAEGIARRLIARGFPAYILDPPAGAPAPVYRVRVGKFVAREQAEQIVRRIEQEEQFKPWITR